MDLTSAASNSSDMVGGCMHPLQLQSVIYHRAAEEQADLTIRLPLRVRRGRKRSLSLNTELWSLLSTS